MSKAKENSAGQGVAVLHADSAGARGRMRALDGDEKQARRETILDAADQLFSQHHDLANVADIAVAAGLAKGTVYLYFQSKEEIYLALHLRHVQNFLLTLIARLKRAAPFRFTEMTALANEHILNAPNYLPLGACCTGFAAGAVPAAASVYFQVRLTEWLETAGAGLERHFSKLARGEGARLLHHSYAIMVGLYSLMRAELSGNIQCAQLKGMGSFQQETSLALTRYWAQVASITVAPVTRNVKPSGQKRK